MHLSPKKPDGFSVRVDMKTFLGAIAGALAVGGVLFAYDLGGRRAMERAAMAPSTQMLVGPDGIARPYLVSGQAPYAQGAVATLPGYSGYATATPLATAPYAYAPVQPQARYVNDRVVSAPVRRVSTTRQVAYEPDVPRRSWQKSALLIGGSAAGGAGLGGLLGGKKGALAGAAIGGGTAAIYDQVKRR
jgi:hypothetical protein